MKKIVFGIIALSYVGLFAGSSFANTACGSVSIVSTGIELDTPFVFLKNETGVACGDLLANGTPNLYYLSTGSQDQALATILTAISLDKKLWVQLTGTAAAGETLMTISMQK